MTGYIEADLRALNEAQRERYRSAYCGLCRALRGQSGQLSRLTLSYDMVFLVLLLSSMYEPEERTGAGCCPRHPFRERPWWSTEYTAYAADVCILLAYHKLLDDWNDDRNLPARTAAAALRTRYDAAAARRPELCRAIEASLAELSGIENAAASDPDAAANCFGRLTGALFSPVPDPVWGERMRAFGAALGRFIYMMDACVDLEQDKKRGRYNPLRSVNGGEVPEEEKLALLKMLIGECTAEFERLPLVQDVEILRSVLYSGVWNQYAARLKTEKRNADDGQRSV